MSKTPIRESTVLERFVAKMNELSPRIRRIVLFGSRARGDELPWSDYDLLVLVDDRNQTLVDAIYDRVVEIQADTGSDLSLKIMSEAEWDRRQRLNSGFVANVLREGIILG